MSASPSSSVRPPVVVVMGHVDHGKSTLLDFIRSANTVAGEAGGITQHVAAYEVEREHEGARKRITFIDTPGHAAFSAIRARGANVADIAILVVAADDGVKAQTLEALEAIRAAKIPFIVAINKIDKPNASIERTQISLIEQGVYLEKFGGDVPWTAISAKTGAGVDELLDVILLVAELHGYAAREDAPAAGYVIEAHRDQKRGLAATLIITDGTLRAGDYVLAGEAVAPVRIMENHAGAPLKSAVFSSPVRLVGFDELPNVGESFQAFPDKRGAEKARESARERSRSARAAETPHEEGESETFFMPVIVRADTSGSLEAILQETARIGDTHARISIVQSGIGSVGEGDVKSALAGRAHAAIAAFNVGTDPVAEALARQHGVRIEHFSIIYKLTEWLQEILEEERPRRAVEEVRGRARVLKIFSSRKQEHVVGGSVLEGVIVRGGEIRVLRKGDVLGTGLVHNIQTNRRDTEKAEAGSEFGAQLEAECEIAPGDVLECVEKRTI